MGTKADEICANKCSSLKNKRKNQNKINAFTLYYCLHSLMHDRTAITFYHISPSFPNNFSYKNVTN